MMSDKCPYCTGTTFSGDVLRRPDQKIERCETCLKYHMHSVRNGGRYPLSNPMDANSLPHIKR